MAWLGLVSYGVYLWHWPVVLFMSSHGIWTENYLLNVLLVTPLTLGAAAGSWYGVERYALRLKQSRASQSPLPNSPAPIAREAAVPNPAPA